MLALQQAGFVLTERYDLNKIDDEAALAQALDGAWAVIAGAERYTREVFERAPKLRVVMRTGVGFDGVDLEAATSAGVAVFTTPKANADAVADFALALMLGCLRQLLVLDDAVRAGNWRSVSVSGDLTGATVGIVGLGAIGKSVVRRLSGFDCKVLAAEPQPDREFCRKWGVELTNLDALLPQVDVLTLHAQMDRHNRHMIGKRELSLMKPTAILINTARGGLIDQTALVTALRSRQLAGAGLDVFENEPLPVNHPLIGLPSVILSSHEASFTWRGINSTLDAAVATLLSLADGKFPDGCVNPRVRDTFGRDTVRARGELGDPRSDSSQERGD